MEVEVVETITTILEDLWRTQSPEPQAWTIPLWLPSQTPASLATAGSVSMFLSLSIYQIVSLSWFYINLPF